MPRTARMVEKSVPTVYHVMSRTALDGFPFGDEEKDEFVRILRKLSKLYFVDVFGFCVMGNHFHALLRIFPGHYFSNADIKARLSAFYDMDVEFNDHRIELYRQKLAGLSEYVKALKHTFSCYYNKLHNRRGTLWGDRFKSVIVESGETLINCLAYIDLNPIRAGLVDRPEEYRWNSIGYHLQTNNTDDFLSLDFGLAEFNVVEKKRLTRYRRYLYESGGIEHPGKPNAVKIDATILKKERDAGFEIKPIHRFRLRTRYFTDAAVIGGKAFVRNKYRTFKHLFQSQKDKTPISIKGLNGAYSLKRLSET